MISREAVRRAIRFQDPAWLPHDFPDPFGTDFAFVGMAQSPDARPNSGLDEWGAEWENIGICMLGEVKRYPLKDWAGFERLPIPDIRSPHRWTTLDGARERAGDKYLLASGISLYERAHFIRGLENLWMDIHEHPGELCRLLDVLVEMNLVAIAKYAAAGADGYIFCDDWGLQDRLMIAPESWRALWKPRYARVFAAARAAGLDTFLHSCGYIVDIMDDLIEVGMDVVHMDQQENMGLDLLEARFGGRVTFFAPVDIQNTMARGSLDDIRAYCRKMARQLGRPSGGFLPRWYVDPQGAGHRREAIDAMCREFLEISREMYGR